MISTFFCSIKKGPLQNVQDSVPSLKRKSPESEIAENETPRKRHNSGHKIGFDHKWKLNRSWLECVENTMICLLCTKFKKKNIWATTGCKSLRLDVVKEHRRSSEHLNSVNLEVEKLLSVAAVLPLSTAEVERVSCFSLFL